MAVTIKKLYNGTLGTGATTLLTAASGKTTVITGMSISNKTGTDATATILFDSTSFLTGKVVTKNDTFVIEGLKSVLEAGDIVSGLAGTGSAIDVIINGYEVS